MSMKATVDMGELARAAAHVSRILDSINPAGAGVKVSAEGTTLTLEGGGANGFARSVIPATVNEPGMVHVNGPWLAGAAAVGGSGETKLREDGIRLRFDNTSNGRKGFVGLMPDAELPDWPELPDEFHRLSDGDFAALVNAVVHTTGRDPNKPILSGVDLVGDGERLTAKATDRYRAAVASIPAPGLVCDVIAPGAWLKGAAGGVTELGTSGSVIALKTEADLDLTPIYDGRFPAVERTFLDSSAVELTIRAERASLLDAVRGARAFDRSGERITRVALDPSGDSVTLRTAGSDEEGGMQWRVDADVTGGVDRTLMFDAAYLADALSADKGSVITLSAAMRKDGTALAPVLFESDAALVRQIVMPLRVGE